MLFKTKEFLITGAKTLSIDIVDKLFWYHIIPCIPVRKELGIPMTASLKSGYRPKWWELRHGRKGGSQHVFLGKGAIDWTCKNFKINKEKLLDLLIKHTTYTRFAIYNGFIHCDYKATPGGDRELYAYEFDEAEGIKKWVFKQIL